MKKAKSSQIYLVLGLVAAVAFLLYTLTASRPAPTSKHRTVRKARAATTAQKIAPPLAIAAPASADFDRYQVILARNVFSPPAPPAVKPPKTAPPKLVQPVKNPTPVPTGPPPPPPAPTFPGWSYAGYVDIGTQRLAIFQNAGSRAFEKVAVGSAFQGARVERATSSEVELKAGSAPSAILHRPDVYAVVPLEKSATATRQGQTGRQPPPGGRGGRGGGA